MTPKTRIYLRFWTGKYYNCLLIQDGKSGVYGWYWPGEANWVSPPDEVQNLIDMWTRTQFAGMELEDFLRPLIGEE